MLDLIIRGATVVTPQQATAMDIGIQGEQIALLAWPGALTADAKRIIDAKGKSFSPEGSSRMPTYSYRMPEAWSWPPRGF